MQISDVNNSLLQMITGQPAQKVEKGPEQSRFADMLEIATPAKENLNVSSEPIKRQNVESSLNEVDKKVDVTEGKSQQNKTPERKEGVNSKNETEKSQAKSTVKETEKKQEGASGETVSQQKVSENEQMAQNEVENPNVSEGEGNKEVGDVEPSADEELALVPLWLPNNDAVVENEVSGDSVETVDGENSVAPIQMTEVESVAPQQDVVDMQEKTIDESVAVKSNDQSSTNEGEIKVVSQASENVAEQKNPEVEVDKSQKNIVQEQEEKIAERLPEDVKVELKVKVEKDTVKVSSKPEEVSQDIIKVQAVETEEPEVQKQVNVEKQEQTAVVADVPSAPVVQTDKASVVANTQGEKIVTATTLTENVAQEQIIAPVMPEIKSAGNVSETGSFKDVYNKGITREVSEQIKVNITQSAIKGVDKIEIQLKPASLGQLEIKLHISKDGQLQAHIIASNQETLDILQKDFESLKDAFNQAGYQTNDESFSFSYRGENQESNEREKLREFIGDVLTQEVAEEMAANDYVGTDRVNIRV